MTLYLLSKGWGKEKGIGQSLFYAPWPNHITYQDESHWGKDGSNQLLKSPLCRSNHSKRWFF